MTHHDAAGTSGAESLDRLGDYKVADGFPDPRGWEVRTTEGRRIGKVDDLLVDRQAMRVKYLDVELDRDVAQRRGDDRHVRIPVGAARLDDARDDVVVDLARAGLGSLDLSGGAVTGAADVGATHAADRLAPRAGDRPADGLAGGLAGGLADRHVDRHVDQLDDASRYDDRRFFGTRMAGREDDAYLTLHEERLDVGTRAVEAGAVELRKTVETERVHETVPLTEEEVTVERRPLAAGEVPAEPVQIGDDEIRVTVMREELVTEKRVVPVEEVIIRKQARTDQHVVEDTVRREVVDIDRTGGAAHAADAARDAARDDTLRRDERDRGV